MYWNVFHLTESYFLPNISLLLVIIFSETQFFGGFYVVLVWSVNYPYISKNRPLKKCDQQNNKSLHSELQYCHVSRLCTIVTKICLTILMLQKLFRWQDQQKKTHFSCHRTKYEFTGLILNSCNHKESVSKLHLGM